MSAATRTGRPDNRASGKSSIAAVIASIVTAMALVVPVVHQAAVAGADELSDKQTQAAQVADQLDALQTRLIELDSQFELIKADLAHANEAVAEAQGRADEANTELEHISAELRSFSIQAYVKGGDDGTFDALSANSANEAPQRRSYIEIASGNRTDLLDRFNATKARAEADAKDLEQARSDAEQRSAELEQAQDDAKAAVAEQASIKSRIDGELATLVAEEQQRRAAEAAERAAEQARQLTQSAQGTQGQAGGAASIPTAASTAPTTPGAQPPSIAQPPATTPPTTAGTPGAPTPPPATPPPVVAPPATPQPPAAPPKPGASGAVSAAMGKIGSPYVWAGGGPNVFDCSGLTMWAYAQVGVYLPHYSGAQYSMSRRISLAEAQPGDLIFFWAPGAGGDPSHVGLYIGGGSMVHAPSAGNFVRVDSIYWWTGARIAAGRI